MVRMAESTACGIAVGLFCPKERCMEHGGWELQCFPLGGEPGVVKVIFTTTKASSAESLQTWVPTEGLSPALPAPTLLERAQGCTPLRCVNLTSQHEKRPDFFVLATEGHGGGSGREPLLLPAGRSVCNRELALLGGHVGSLWVS